MLLKGAIVADRGKMGEGGKARKSNPLLHQPSARILDTNLQLGAASEVAGRTALRVSQLGLQQAKLVRVLFPLYNQTQAHGVDQRWNAVMKRDGWRFKHIKPFIISFQFPYHFQGPQVIFNFTFLCRDSSLQIFYSFPDPHWDAWKADIFFIPCSNVFGPTFWAVHTSKGKYQEFLRSY